MAEIRCVLTKYYPPDLDPAKITTTKRPRSKQPWSARMLLPITITCMTCRRNIYEGNQFNTHKEKVCSQAYLGIEVFRFYFKCPCCSAEISVRINSQNSECLVESGAFRNYNYKPLRHQDEVAI